MTHRGYNADQVLPVHLGFIIRHGAKIYNQLVGESLMLAGSLREFFMCFL